MAQQFPSADEVRKRLSMLTQGQLEQVAKDSSVPLPTLLKIRYGTTKNPGVETLRKFWHLVDRRKEARA